MYLNDLVLELDACGVSSVDNDMKKLLIELNLKLEKGFSGRLLIVTAE